MDIWKEFDVTTFGLIVVLVLFVSSTHPQTTDDVTNTTTILATNTSDITQSARETQDDDVYLFRSSICYDVTGAATVGIYCPVTTYRIESALAFTAVSQNNTCSYRHWDCILQEGSTQECDARDSCTVVAQYDQRRHDVFRCGDNGTTMFLQVEYYCVSGKTRSNKIHDVQR